LELRDLVRLWEMENDNIDIEKDICERHFLETTKIDKNGRNVVKTRFKNEKELRNSKAEAKTRLIT